MTNVDNNKLYLDRKNYLLRLLPREESSINALSKPSSIDNPISKSVRHALEYFVDDLRRNRDKTIERFLTEQTVDDIFRSIAQLLLSDDDRICGNSAFILGSAVELESGLQRFLSIFGKTHTTNNTVDVIRVFCHLLTHSDSECILNAAGTLGTICSSKEGRDMILHHACIAQMVMNTSALLSSANSWIASNAALVLARITVEELGCQTILTHSKHRDILTRLMSALNISDPNRSTNAAFAIGRLIEGDEGKKTLISDCGQYQIFDALLLMLEANEEKGVNKNACYALSCLCTTSYGFQLCLQYLTAFHRILLSIETVLASTEHETVWFALMCLRTMAQYDGANEHLCYSKSLLAKLKHIREKWTKSKDIQEEAKLLWYMIHRNVKPTSPKIDECRNTSVDISWVLSVHIWDEKELQFRLFLNDQPIDVTTETNYCLKNLTANTKYHLQIQYITSFGDSVRSDPTIFYTDEELPPPVRNLHVERTTMTGARIAWESPDFDACSSVKGYQIYLNEIEHECTTDCSFTIGSLTAKTTYQVDVCVVSNKGKGPRMTIHVTTGSAGDSYPAPPTFSVIGRREIHIKWQPPEVISGRLTRYELLCDKRCIYSGIEQEYHATMLTADTPYTMVVVVITNEGRFPSRPAKTRTLKDEFNHTHRHSLYETPTQIPPKMKRTETVHSTGSTNTTTKTSTTTDRRSSREVIFPSRNVEITSVRSLQLKTDAMTINRSLPTSSKDVQPRQPSTKRTRQLPRSRTDPISIHHLPQQAPITARIVAPTFSVAREPQVTWATCLAPKVTSPTSYRLSTQSNPSPTSKFKRSTSSSLPELPRTQSLIQS